MEPEGLLPRLKDPATCPYQINPVCPHPTSWRSILILSSHLRLGLPSDPLSSCFPTRSLYAPLLSPTRATCPTNLIILDLIAQIIFGEYYRSKSSSLCSLLQSLVTLSLLGPNIFLNALFWNTHSLRSSLDVSDPVLELNSVNYIPVVMWLLWDSSGNMYVFRMCSLVCMLRGWISIFDCNLTFRRVMSYIYGAPILDVSRSHTTTQHSR